MIRRVTSAALGLAIAVVLAGCGGTASSSSPESVDGTWGDSTANYLTLSDGTLRGSDGCNGMRGSYSVDGSTVTFTLGAATLKACIDVDTWLRNIATATVDGDTLTVFDASGEQIGTLPRTA